MLASLVWRVMYTGHTQENGAVLIVNTIKTTPFFCVCSVLLYEFSLSSFVTLQYIFICYIISLLCAYPSRSMGPGRLLEVKGKCGALDIN
jgi:hypothetical protein